MLWIDGSTDGLFWRVVVVVVLGAVVVVVQPTNAITQTPNTNGINFFIRRFYPNLPSPSIFFPTLVGRDSVEPLSSSVCPLPSSVCPLSSDLCPLISARCPLLKGGL